MFLRLGGRFLPSVAVCSMIFCNTFADVNNKGEYQKSSLQNVEEFTKEKNISDSAIETVLLDFDDEADDVDEELIGVAETEKSLLEQQRSFVKQYMSDIQDQPESIISLKELIDKHLEVTEASFESIKKDPDTAFLRIDMYKGANLPTMILEAIRYLESGASRENDSFLAVLKKDSNLQKSLGSLKSALSDLTQYQRIDFSNESYFSDYEKVLIGFNEVINCLNETSSFAHELSYFSEFIRLSQKFTNLLYVRYNTEKMLSAIRSSLEGIQGMTASSSASISINIPVPAVPGMTVNADLFANSLSYGSTGLSFYTVTKSKGTKAGVTFNISPAKISGKLSMEVASMQLFYSLEAYLDYFNSLSLKKMKNLRSKFSGINGMTETAQNRKELQKKEREALANNGMFEEYMKEFCVIPATNTSLVWVNLTRAKTGDQAKEITVGVDLSAGVTVPLSSLGLTLKAAAGAKKYTKEISLLSFLNEDCSVVNGLTVKDLVSEIGKKNDFSEKFENPSKLLKTLNTYNFALGKLETAISKTEKKIWEKKKQQCEGLLTPKKAFGSRGRESALRTAILTAAILRENSAGDAKEVLIFKNIYEKLHQLVQLSVFSKNNKGIRKTFHYGIRANAKAKVKAKIRNLTASFSTAVPYAGNVSVSAIKKWIKGSPLFEENGKYITLSFSLPVYSGGTVGMAVLREKFRSVFADAPKKKLPINMDDFKSVALAFGLTKGISAGGSALTSIGAPIGVSASGAAAFTFVWKYSPSQRNQEIVPLPGQDLLTRKKGQWVLDFVAVSNSVSAGINMDKVEDLPVSVKYTSSMGKVGKRTGSDTFHDMSSKFNVLSLGKEDSQSNESTAINSLLKGQSGQLLKTFRKIAKMNTNAAFELQDIYNKLLAQSSSKEEKREYETLFANFIRACKNLGKKVSTNHDENANSGVEEAEELSAKSRKSDEESYLNMEEFNKAFDLYRAILEKQYEHIFKPYYNRAFSKIKV